jgi:hypothetical protein
MLAKPNDAWSMDFSMVHHLADGLKLQTLTIVDFSTKEALAVGAS